MPGTQYFQDKQKKSLNNFVNDKATSSWMPDQKYALELANTSARVQNDLETGILTKFRVLRTRQLEGIVTKNCWENDKFTFAEADMCSKFHFDNDYKMKAIDSFWNDHFPKHFQAYKRCSEGLEGATSVGEKDKAYADCHNDWMRDFKENQSQSLELRARTLLGKNLA